MKKKVKLIIKKMTLNNTGNPKKFLKRKRKQIQLMKKQFNKN